MLLGVSIAWIRTIYKLVPSMKSVETSYLVLTDFQDSPECQVGGTLFYTRSTRQK